MLRPQITYERDDGLFQIGLSDEAPGPFASREFAAQIAAGHPPAPAIAKPRRVIREVRRNG